MDEFTFWSGNQKWATYSMAVSGTTIYFTLTGTNAYFGGRLIAKGTYNPGGADDKVALASIATDRLGSVANNGVNKFYPYGQERASTTNGQECPWATTNDKEKFTGYFRDAATGLDYAGQRYHNPGQGRFMTPDAAPSASTKDPGSWNRYAYTRGDPVNRVDPSGLVTFRFMTSVRVGLVGPLSAPGVTGALASTARMDLDLGRSMRRMTAGDGEDS